MQPACAAAEQRNILDKVCAGGDGFLRKGGIKQKLKKITSHAAATVKQHDNSAIIINKRWKFEYSSIFLWKCEIESLWLC